MALELLCRQSVKNTINLLKIGQFLFLVLVANHVREQGSAMTSVGPKA